MVPITTDGVWDNDAKYIVIGNVFNTGVSLDSDDFIISPVNKSVVVLAKENNYLAAAIRFLEETIGYRGLNDDYATYTVQEDASLTTALISEAIHGDVAFETRGQTNHNYGERTEYKGINGATYFNQTGPVYQNANCNLAHHNIHNSMYWLPNGSNKYPIYDQEWSTLPDDYTSNTAWYSSYEHDAVSGTLDDGTSATYTPTDLCYTARNAKATSDSTFVKGDTNAYDAMVYWTAQHMLNVLSVLEAKGADKILTFGCMDDYAMDYACECAGCSSYTDKTATKLVVGFLNDVIATMRSTRTDFVVYLLGYYYAEDPAGVTVSYPDNFGVIYAPISREFNGGTNGVETLSIYEADNDTVRTRITTWAGKTNNMAFWFYDTMFYDFMMPLNTFESMVTWLEFAARTCKGKNIAWVNVNGQSKGYNPTGFEDFKSYIVQKAEIEVLEKITADYSTNSADYNSQLAAYMTELEDEFFGRENGVFTNKGYYGPAAANQAMYNFYTAMRTDLGVGKRCSDLLDEVSAVSITWTFENWLTYGSTANTYLTQWSKDDVDEYMGYLEAAMAALDTSDPAYELHKRHILQESLFPRFIVCMGNHSSYWANGYTHSGSVWNSTTIADARSAFKTDFEALGNTQFSEHVAMTKIFTKWGL